MTENKKNYDKMILDITINDNREIERFRKRVEKNKKVYELLLEDETGLTNKLKMLEQSLNAYRNNLDKILKDYLIVNKDVLFAHISLINAVALVLREIETEIENDV